MIELGRSESKKRHQKGQVGSGEEGQEPVALHWAKGKMEDVGSGLEKLLLGTQSVFVPISANYYQSPYF